MDAPAAWPRLPGTPRPERAGASVSTLSGVGPALERRLAKLGLRTVRDLLEHRPRRLRGGGAGAADRRPAVGEEAAIAGEVRSRVGTPRRGATSRSSTRGSPTSSGEIAAVWFNQAWLADKLQPGTRVRLRGQLQRSEFQVRSYDLNGVAATADFAPVYPASEEMTPQRLRGARRAGARRSRATSRIRSPRS